MSVGIQRDTLGCYVQYMHQQPIVQDHTAIRWTPQPSDCNGNAPTAEPTDTRTPTPRPSATGTLTGALTATPTPPLILEPTIAGATPAPERTAVAPTRAGATATMTTLASSPAATPLRGVAASARTPNVSADKSKPFADGENGGGGTSFGLILGVAAAVAVIVAGGGVAAVRVRRARNR
jgi:hypothetical protein